MASSPLLAPHEMYPAPHDGAPTLTIRPSVRKALLASGLTVRVAECHPARIIDPGGPAGARAILLLHGWGCSLYAFRFLYAPLAALGYHIFAPDLPGHGLSDKPHDRESYTLDGMTGYVGEIIAALRLSRPTILGHSMGGRIAVEYALRNRRSVDRLVLVNSVGFGPMPHITAARPFAALGLASILPTPLPRWLVSIPVRAVYGGSTEPTDRDIDEYRAPTQFRGFIRASGALLRNFDWRELSAQQVAALPARTALIVGSEDRVVQSARAGRPRVLADIGVEVTVVPGVAHVVHEERPDVVLDVVRR